MKTMLFAAAAALSLGSAYAEDAGQGLTRFTTTEARPPAKEGAPPFQVIPPTGSPTYFYSTRRPLNQGTWVFPPHEDGGANN